MTLRAFHINAILLVLMWIILASCTSNGQAIPSQGTTVPSSFPTGILAEPGKETQDLISELSEKYSFPKLVDPAQRYMFYLHGKIIEDQGLLAISPEYGEYQYEEILAALESYGFVVISEPRMKDTIAAEYAQRIVSQVDELLNAGVDPGSITVVGASKGAAITSLVSNMVSNPEMNYVLLGACYQPMIEEWKKMGTALSGNVLAIYDSSDEYATSCDELFDFSAGKGLGRQSELVLELGSGHGILYEPLVEWMLPTVQWANHEG